MLDAFERLGQARAGEHVARARVALAGAAAAEGADVVAAREQRVDELGADVAGRAGDKDGIRLAHVIGCSYPGAVAGNPDRARRRRLSRATPVKKLAIKDLAEQTGVAAGTIRMWEQRYGFPEPERTAAGYRVYTEQDVVALRRVVAYRNRGLSVPAALERARSLEGPTDRPSIFAALASGDAPVRPQRLRRPTLIALSRAIEEEAMARAAGPGRDRRLPVGGQLPRGRAPLPAAGARRRRRRRVRELRRAAASATRTSRPRSRSRPRDALGHEWAVVVDAPGYAACLVGWETPDRDGDRIFEAVWTMDAPVVRRAAQVGAALAARSAPEWSERLLAMLADRPLAVEAPAPGLTALTNRMIGYLDASPSRSDDRGRAAAVSTAGNPVDRPLEHLTADREADLRQLAGGADRGRDELGAGRRADRLRRRRRPRAAALQRRGARDARPWGRAVAAVRAAAASARALARGRAPSPRRSRRRRDAVGRCVPGGSRAACRARSARLALGLRFALRRLLRHRGPSVRLDRSAFAWDHAVIDDRPTARAAMRSAGYTDRLQTAGGSRQSMRLDSATTAVGEGGPNARFRSRQAHIQKGRLSASLARTGHPCLLWICKNSKKSRG